MKNNNLNIAVILAAGMGKRLGNINKNQPKGMIKIGKSPIIKESIEKLLRAGIKKVFIVTGYKSEVYKKLFASEKNIEILENKNFAETNTLYSLSKIDGKIESDFLLLESDLIYDYAAIPAIMMDKHENVILVSSLTGHGDEVFVEAKQEFLVKMSKNLTISSKKIYGEFVGINKISIELYKRMMQYFNKSKQKDSLSYEEDALVNCAKSIKIKCLLLPKLNWSEIDDAEHLNIAKKIYSNIN